MGLFFRVSCLVMLVGVSKTPRSAVAPRPTPQLQSGDVVLHTSTSSRSAIIRRASGSPYSHVGVIEVAADGVFVIEAVQPVSRTPWAVWRGRGAEQKVTVLRDDALSDEQRARIVSKAKSWLGRAYDTRYRWDDERLYCSELVVKAYAAAGVDIGTQTRVKDLHLSAAELASAPQLGVDGDQTLVTPGSVAEDAHFHVLFSDFTDGAPK